ncbi:MAG: hypothetical protein HYR60_23165 [Acidobacteria bacterium]|nr:hypothetical protein [Acidobacteriota bacterium]
MPFCLAAQTAPSRFHHLHLNATDPAAAVDFYTGKFDCEKATYEGRTAVWAQKSFLLFNKVAAAPPAEVISAIWHFGWGAENMKETYQKQLDMGTRFSTPITELFPNFFFAYVDGPDRAIIELNTAQHHHFGHLHLLSADAVSAGEWYVKHFGATWRGNRVPSRQPSFIRNFQTGPNASLMMDNVNIIIFPIEYARQAFPEWKDRTAFATPQGRVVDHVAFSVDNLAVSVEALRKEGVKILEKAAGRALIEGPDNIRIELVEGHARKE